MSQGVVTESLVSLIAKQVEESSLVVWYDFGGDYRDLAACIEVPGASIARHDGSFLKLRRDIDSQNSEFRHPSNYWSEQFAKGIRTPIKLSIGAICEDIGYRSRAALRDRTHRDDRRVCVIT